MDIRRGSVWWWHCPYHDRKHIQEGKRPVVVVSNDMCNHAQSVVTVVPFTTRVKRPYPQHVPVIFDENVSIALTEQMTSIPVNELGSYICDLREFQMNQIDTAMSIQLGLVDMSDKPYAPCRNNK